MCAWGKADINTEKLYEKTLQNLYNRTLAPGSRREANQMISVSKVYAFFLSILLIIFEGPM